MLSPQALDDWMHYLPADGDIKVEAQPEFSLLSPPISPFGSPSFNPALPTSLCRRRSSSLANPKRVRPYPLSRDNRSRPQDLDNMATGPAYTNWTKMGSTRHSERRSSDGDQPLAYNAIPNVASQFSRSPEIRPASTTSSSLTNAMGTPPIRYTSPSSETFGMSSNMPWATQLPNPLYGVPGPAYFSDPSAELYYDISPESNSPPAFMSESSTSGMNPNYASSSSMNPQDEIRRLRRRVQELEQIHAQDKERLRSLDQELRRGTSSTASQSPSFQSSWKARTDARIRRFCSLNRAGNALCSWHDSRRERRIHPPRMAPPGFLNCGCSYDEALFEESLARHNVGSYLPGETVRMDPALRNPLLKLLQQRYGYCDGDFERDPRTGSWLPGEGAAYWEQQVQSGSNPPRKVRLENDRR
ncbi:hypothetical protein C8J56DRAFT_1011133 [Mycena floridula]|nr:hypothetical protein C8J56DRAFT_1011133 [Mycena floridula]